MKMASMQRRVLLLIFSILSPALVLSVDSKDLLNELSNNATCSNLTYVDDLNMEKLEGVWYIPYQVNPMLPLDPLCQSFEMKTTSLDTLDISMHIRIFPGLVMKAKANGKLIDPTEPAITTLTWDFLPDQPQKTIIVETDYNNYAILAFCNESEEAFAGFLLSREINIPDEYFTHGKEVLGQYFDTSIGQSMGTDICDLDPISPYEQVLEMDIPGLEDLFKEAFGK